MTATRIEGYVALLQGIREDLLVQALADLAKTEKWFPKPAHIMERVGELREQMRAAQIVPFPEAKRLPERGSVTPEEAEQIDGIIRSFKQKMGWKW